MNIRRDFGTKRAISTAVGRAVSVIYLAVTCIIFFSIFVPTKNEYSFGNSSVLAKISTVVLVALGLLPVIFIYRKIKGATLGKKKLWILRFFSVLLCGILVAIFSYDLTPQAINGFDSSNIYDLVNKYVNHLPIDNLTYFNVYPHNLAIVLFYLVPAKIAHSLLGIDTFFAMMLVTDVAVILSAVLLMAILSILFKKDEKAFLFGLFGVILLPFLAYSAELYTDSISLFLVLLGFYLYLLTRKTKHKYLVWVLFSITSCLSVTIKVTAVIILVAILLAEGLSFARDDRNKKKQKILFLLLFVGVFWIFSGGYSLIEARILPDAKNMAIPKTHWVMMGLQGDGGYSDDDFNATIANGPDRVGYNIRVIKERLGEMGPIGYAGLLVRKISVTWGEGTYNLVAVVSGKPRRADSATMKIFYREGDYFGVYNFVANLIQVGLVSILAIWGVLTVKQFGRTEMILKLSVIGIFLFLLVWETISRYLVNFLPILIISARYAFDEIEGLPRRLRTVFLRRKGEKKKK